MLERARDVRAAGLESRMLARALDVTVLLLRVRGRRASSRRGTGGPIRPFGGMAVRGLAAAVLTSALAWVSPAAAASKLSLGPRAVQTLIAEQLFTRGGRWYLIDDGACYTYLESPHAHIATDRLVLNAHLSSKLGQRIGNGCAGADFASDVTLSGTLRAADHTLILDDIRIERIDDEATRGALDLVLQLAPHALPRSASIDVLASVGKQALGTGTTPVHLDQFHIVNLTTRTNAVIIQFDMSLTAP